MRLAASLALVVLAASGCAAGKALGIAECPGLAPVSGRPYPRYSPDSAALLAGVYELIELNLSGGMPAKPYRARLVLLPNGEADKEVVLRGTATWLNDEGNPQATETATIDFTGKLATQFFGWPTTYRIVVTDRTGLWGLWERPTDGDQLQVVETATNRVHPNPAGVFCAVRQAGWSP